MAAPTTRQGQSDAGLSLKPVVRSFKFRERMAVRVGCFSHEMVVAVGVRDRVRVDAAAVEMRVGMRVRMRVVPHERIDHDERRTRDHHGERRKIHPRQVFPQQQERKKRPHERRNGIVGTRLRRPERVLGAHVQEDAEPVGHKAEDKRGGDVRAARQRLLLGDGNDERAESREDSLKNDDLVRALRRDALRSCVFRSERPAMPMPAPR